MKLNRVVNGTKWSECHHIWWVGSAVLRFTGKVVESVKKKENFVIILAIFVFLTAFGNGDH